MKNVVKNINYYKYYNELLPYFKEEKAQRYFFLILTFGASIFFLLFAISPTLSTIAKLNKQISDSRFVDQKLNNKIQSLSSLSQSYNNIQPDLSYATDAVPKGAEVPNFAALVQGAARDTSSSITDISVSKVDLEENVATLSSSFTFNMTVTGDYNSLKNFINELTKMQRVVTIESMQMSQSADSLQAQIIGSAFYKP
jgi:Tfp pilus assembly protein PilO